MHPPTHTAVVMIGVCTDIDWRICRVWPGIDNRVERSFIDSGGAIAIGAGMVHVIAVPTGADRQRQQRYKTNFE